VVTETAFMAEKSKKPGKKSGTEQYRKPHKMVRIRGKLAADAEAAAEKLDQDLTQFVNDSVRERLERLGIRTPLSGGSGPGPS
jgi:predicted HicB family RNase H-like nuclease